MKRYQAVAFLLSTAMTVSSVAPVFGASNDIFGHWAEFTITKWQNEGRIGGYEDGTFKPDRAITRAEFVRLLNSAAPTAFTSSASINFSDVSESDWFYADVAKAVGGRVASGFEDGTFRPGETVTRMQAAVFICNAKGLTPNEAAANNFTDAAQIPSWAKGAVGAAVAAGYLSGYPDGSFGGSKGMTRAEAVSTLDRVLGGGSTTTTPSGEIDTTNRDNNHSTEDNRTAEAGNMVWTSGGSGGGSKKSSSSSSSSSSDKKTNNVTIRSQKEANEYEGKTLTGTTSIYVDGSGIDLKDIRFKGDVDIYADDTATAAAYIGEDTAVAAANSTVDIYFEGKTNVSGTITVIRNTVAGADKVVIKTRTPRALSASVLAKVATKIVGFELSRVEAQAPVEIAEGAKVNTVEAGDNAIVEVAADASVDKVDVTGDAKDIVLNGEGSTDVTVKNGASADQIVVDSTEATVELEGSAKVNDVYVVGDGEAAVKVNDNAKVENVQVSDSASADIAVADKAAIGTVKLSDTATAKVDVAPEAKVDTISSTSTGKTEVSGEGTVDKIEATNPSTVDTSNAGENIPTVDKKDETTTTPTPGGDSSTTAKTIKGADLATLTIAKPTAAGAATITGTPEGVKASGTWAEKTAEPEATASAEGETTKTYSATITLEAAEAGKVVFDTAIAAADFKGVTDVTIVEGSVKATAEKVTFDVSAEVTEGGGDTETPVIKVSAPADVVVDTAAQTVTVVDLSATLSNAGTIADGTKMTWTAKATGITGDVKFGTDEATAETTGSSDITASNGKTSIKMFVPAGQVGTITVTAKCTVDGKEFTETVPVKLAAKVDENTVAEKLKAVEDGMKSDATSPKTVDLLVTDDKTIIGEKVAEVAKTLVDGYDVTFAANDVTLTEATTEVTGKFTVQQSGNTDISLAKTSATDITVKVAVKKAPIETVAISLTAPADGVAIANATTTGTGYAVKSTTWKEVGGANDMVTDDTFAAGAAYQATVVLEASTGYTFNAETAKTDVTGAEKTEITPKITTDTDTLTLLVTYAALDDGSDNPGDNDPAITSLTGKLTSNTDGTASNAITVTKGDAAQTIDLSLVTENFTDTGDDVVLEIKAANSGTLDANTGFMNNDALDSANKITKTISASDLKTTPTQSLKVQVGADQTGSFTITAKIGDTGTPTAATTVTVTVDGGGGSGTEITNVDELAVTVPKGATEVPESTSLNVESGKGYTAKLDWSATENNSKFVTVESKKYFKAGETYKATITLTPDQGKTFKDVSSVSVTGITDVTSVPLNADTSEANKNNLVGTVDVTIADGTATVAAADGGVSGTAGGAVTGTVTITLDGDAFNAIEESADLSSLFEFTGLPNDLTPKVNAAVSKGAKTAVIKFDGNLASGATTINDISVKIKAAALVSGKTDGISATGNFAITVPGGGTGDDVGGENSIAPASISDETQEPAEQETVEE